MGMPTWWDDRRYGLFVHATMATVPAWAPIGQDSAWYWSHLGDVDPSPQPMVEVLAHHRERWGHIERYDDFLELLTFDRFDAEAWARLAVDSGMGYSVLVSKHHDGLCWWDAPGTERTVLQGGPRRNVLAEYAAACERNDVVFGAYYSLLDWGDARYPDEQYVDEIAHAHVIDLVERYGARALWGDTQWDHGSDHWKMRELLDRLHEIDPELVINDRRRDTSTVNLATDAASVAAPVVRTFEHDPPDKITPGPWEVWRSIGNSRGHNRNERDEHHMSGFDIVGLLTEVVAKGGNLLLAVGPAADGSIPEMQAAPLRDAGTWVRAHHDLVHRSTPWDTWGDDNVRYVIVDSHLHAIDLAGAGHFAAIDRKDFNVISVERIGASSSDEMHFDHDETGLHLDLPRSAPWRRSALPINGDVAVDVAVYRLELSDVDKPTELFDSVDQAPIELAPLLANADPGEIVQLGDGVYLGPATLPPAVILRGLGPTRTVIVIGAGGGSALTLGRSSRVEHLRISTSADGDAAFGSAAVDVDGQFATVLGCEIDGHLNVRADDALVRATSMIGVHSNNVDRVTVSRCQLYGTRRDIGVLLVGGADHEIDSCEFSNHLCAVRAVDTTGTVVRGNNIEARWWAIHLEGTERAHVHGNQIAHTMRAVDVDGGTSALVEGNAVIDGDSGCIIERGAADCRVSGNHWERCRIGLLAWDATGLQRQDNHVLALHDPESAVIIGP